MNLSRRHFWTKAVCKRVSVLWNSVRFLLHQTLPACLITFKTPFLTLLGAGTGLVTLMLSSILAPIQSIAESNAQFHLTATDLS